MTTVLSAGDIAFTAYRSDNPDRVDFVLLVDVEIGTEIVFTDNGWTAADAFRDSEGEAVWRAPADLSAGTVVRLGEDDLGSIALSAAGDQIIAFQGTIASPSFVAMIQMNGDFDDDSTSSNSSTLPADLTEGTHALAIAPAVDNALYDGSVTSGSRSELLAAINDPSNWIGSNSPQDAGMFVASADFGGDTPPPAVVINEIDSDTAGADSAEFVELFGAPDQALDGLTVVFFNGNGDVAYEAFDLDGQMLDSNGYFVLGNSAVANVDVTFANGTLQNGADAVALFQADAADFSDGTAVTNVGLIDAIVYDTDDTDDTGLLDVLAPGGSQFDEDGEGDREGDSLQRLPNGTSDFVPLTPTPGSENVDPPPPEPEIVAIFDVQGSGAASSFVGQNVIVEGVVTGDFQTGDADDSRNLGGFFVQDADGDGDASTSDGIFVFDGSLGIDVAPGDVVQVTGTVAEFFGETQIAASAVTVTGAADVPAPAPISFPAASTFANADGELIADLEHVEGMLVTPSEPLFVTELFNYDRFGELRASQGDRLFQFTNDNAPDVAGFANHLQDIASRTLTIDDGLTVQNPDPIQLPQGGALTTANAFRMVDEISDLVGNIRFSRGSGGSGDEGYRLQLTEDATITTRNPRPDSPEVGGDLKVASFNVLNFFTTLDEGDNKTGPGNAFDPRGADNQAEFDRQLAKLVTALDELDADIVGLQEIENNGYGPDSAIATLTDALNVALGDGTYAFVDPGTAFLGDDAIAVGFIYKTETIELADGTSVEILDDSVFSPDQPVFTGPSTSRSPLAATFEEVASGEQLTIAINHFKSKGGNGTGDDADTNDGAGNFNGTRVRSSEALDAWLATDPTGSGDEDFLIIGDLNAYAQEDPVKTLKNLGYDNLLMQLGGSQPYSFVFDGQAGALDYAFSTTSLTGQVTGLAEYHLNADEPDAIDYNLDFGRPAGIFDGTVEFRVSDHDPLVIGLDLESDEPLNVIAGDDGRNTLFGTREDDEIDGRGGSDLIIARAGNDLIIGGPGPDRINAGAGDDTIRPETGRDRIRGGRGEDTVILGNGDRDSIWRDFREDEDAGLLLTYEDLLTDPDTLTIDASRIELVDVRRDLQVRVDLDGDGTAETVATTLGRAAGAAIEDIIINPLETLMT